MIKRNNKKGFTIVELVIVIAVIAILAAVLIPTFAGIIKKANISKDTQLAKNLNTILISEEAEGNKPADFSEVLSVLRENGYVVENLNPTTEGCYFVWESASNQIMLVDKDFQIIYVAEALTENTAICETWFFAVKDAASIAAIEAKNGSVVPALDAAWINGNGQNLEDLLLEGGVVTLNESVTIATAPNHTTADKFDGIRIDSKKDVVYNLAGQTMTVTNEFVTTNYALFPVKATNFTLADGTIVASVKNVGDLLSLMGVINAYGDANVTVENMDIVYNGAQEPNAKGFTGNVFDMGDCTGTLYVKDTTVTFSNAMGAEITGEATFENVTFKNDSADAWNNMCVAVSTGGTANIKSGTYIAGSDKTDYAGSCVGVLPSGGTLNISGGSFEGGLYLDANDGKTATINVTGGTFDGKAFNSITEGEWRDMLVGCDATEKATVVITGAGTNNVTIKLAK